VSWQLLVPVKATRHAKTRLGPAFGERRLELALAFALDTIAAAAECPAVKAVTVVSSDPRVAKAAPPEVQVVDEGPTPGLNAAISFALTTMPAPANTAVLLGDLPALTAAELEHALMLASAHESAFVPDADGIGTTLLTARSGVRLEPRFGPASAAAHEHAGAVRLDDGGITRVRRDVDDLAGLVKAARLGFGGHTRCVVDGLVPTVAGSPR
jgi:2-phospho-L-lactate guanylyltransferase